MEAISPPPVDSSMTLRDHVGQIIKGAVKPVALADLKKALKQRNVPVGGKNGFKDVDIERAASDELADGSAFPHPPAKTNGPPRFWHTAFVPPPTKPPLAESVREVLKSAVGPLLFKDVKAALKKADALVTAGSNKTTDSDIEVAIREISALGHCFSCESGKGGAVRYWHRDEEQALRDATVRLTITPLSMAKLTKALAGEVQGADARFAEGVVRDLIGDGRVFEHPPAKAEGAPLYATTPPPPPLAWYESKAYKKPFEALVKAGQKVMSAGEHPLSEILDELRRQLDPDALHDPTPTSPLSAQQLAELEELILSTVKAQQPVAMMWLNELRHQMPEHFRGWEFDAAVLRLARSHKVRIQQDAAPTERTAQQEAEFVRSEQGDIFTSIGA